ncbi:MAG: hypothetical protein GXY03_14755 [Solirubrobacterales bacterium]|nr:hypothetical protein [Solirubrobacterales bacterium]
MAGPGEDLRGIGGSGGESLDARLLGRVDAAFDCALDRAEAAVLALAADAPRTDRLAALLAGLTGAAAADRDLARLALVEAPGLGPGALARKDAAVGRLAGLLAREVAGPGTSQTASEMAAGGIYEVLQRRLAAPGPADPAALAADLAALWLPVLTGDR